MVFAISGCTLMFYLYNAFRATCGWEEIYVCIIEMFAAGVTSFNNSEMNNPFTVYLSTGHRVVWLRYFEWLMTCPVILVHLSNLTGLKNHYSSRTMSLLVSDIGTIVMGVTAALAYGWMKPTFFVLGCVFGATTYWSALQVYIEAYRVVPRGTCQRMVIAMAIIYFISWSLYPIVFAIGPEGFGENMSYHVMNLLYTAGDVLSKNVWGILGHILRNKVHEAVRNGWQLPEHMQAHVDVADEKTSGFSLFHLTSPRKVAPDGRQPWVQDIQAFKQQTLLLLAEIHQRLRGEEPGDDESEDGPEVVMNGAANTGTDAAVTIKAGGPGAVSNRRSSTGAERRSSTGMDPRRQSMSRRKSIGDMLAEAVITSAKSQRFSTSGKGSGILQIDSASDSGQLMGPGGRNSADMLRVLLGNDYDKVMGFLAQQDGKGPAPPAGNRTSTSGKRSTSFAHDATSVSGVAIAMPAASPIPPSPTANQPAGSWQARRSGSGSPTPMPGRTSGKFNAIPETESDGKQTITLTPVTAMGAGGKAKQDKMTLDDIEQELAKVAPPATQTSGSLPNVSVDSAPQGTPRQQRPTPPDLGNM